MRTALRTVTLDRAGTVAVVAIAVIVLLVGGLSGALKVGSDDMYLLIDEAHGTHLSTPRSTVGRWLSARLRPTWRRPIWRLFARGPTSCTIAASESRRLPRSLPSAGCWWPSSRAAGAPTPRVAERRAAQRRIRRVTAPPELRGGGRRCPGAGHADQRGDGTENHTRREQPLAGGDTRTDTAATASTTARPRPERPRSRPGCSGRRPGEPSAKLNSPGPKLATISSGFNGALCNRVRSAVGTGWMEPSVKDTATRPGPSVCLTEPADQPASVLVDQRHGRARAEGGAQVASWAPGRSTAAPAFPVG